MPPKKKGGRKKKKKKEEPQPFRPEPQALDENEVAYVWDRIAPIAPNPLSTAATLYTYATNQSVVATGPVPSVVAGAASSSVPLLSPHPPPTPGHPQSQGSGTGKRGANAGSSVQNANLATIVAPTAVDPASPKSGEESDAPTAGGGGGSEAPSNPSAPFRNSNFFVATRPLRSSKEIKNQRTALLVCEGERKWQERVQELDSATAEERDIHGSINAHRVELEAERKDLATQINQDEYTLETNTDSHQKELDKQKLWYGMKLEGLGGTEQGLRDKEEHVKAMLQDRDLNRAQIKAAREKLDSLKKTHELARKEKEAQLNADVERLKVDMVNRLKKTMQDMEDLTMQHKERRQQRAVSESARLVSKLTTLEAQSKKLTASNTKLGAKVESTKRDQQLEQERHTLLAKKSMGLAQEIRELSAQLQKCEKLFSERTGATNQSQEVLTLSETIDRQYRVILELKSELDTVKSDTNQLQMKLKEVQRSQFKALQSVASGNATAIVTQSSNQQEKNKSGGQIVPVSDEVVDASSPANDSVSPSAIESPNEQSKIHGLVVKAVADINKSMLEMSQGQRGIETVTDPKEQAELLGYIMKRVAMFRSGVFPTKPSVVKKSGAVGSLVSKSMSTTPSKLLKGPADTPDSVHLESRHTGAGLNNRGTPSSQQSGPLYGIGGIQSARGPLSGRSSTSSMSSAVKAAGGATYPASARKPGIPSTLPQIKTPPQQ